ncbi:MAG: hydroxymethylglutaryl-CoA synthase [Candidatus Woesearchaeota archaeon]
MKRLQDTTKIIHNLGMQSILYTGVFGTENLKNNPLFYKYVQRDKNHEPLFYGKSEKTAMMCPSSDYVNKVTIPKLQNLITKNPFDGIFIDIPWILNKGCHCNNCQSNNKIKDENKNEKIVRDSLDKIVTAIKDENPQIKISINSSAPLIYNNKSSGAHITNLTNLFDEYVTEWNPYKWNQDANILKKSINYAHKLTQKRILHATTLTNKYGKMYTQKEYTHLFSTIMSAGADMRLGISFPPKQLKIIHTALQDSTYH